MKISKPMNDALNKQINQEFFSFYLYQSMSAHFESETMKGFANWMGVQAREETSHAMKIYKYVIERGGKVILEKIEKPKNVWVTPLEAFKEAYDHEKSITKMIHNLVDIARKENDHPTESMLKWFVDEQVEEEASTEELVIKLEMIKDNPGASFMLDSVLAGRK